MSQKTKAAALLPGKNKRDGNHVEVIEMKFSGIGRKQLVAEMREKRHALSVGSDLVERPRYDVGERKIYINATQSFDNVDAATYAFKIGGYTVADKWLSDRKGRVLSFEERRLYPQILVALAETQRIMTEIEELETL